MTKKEFQKKHNILKMSVLQKNTKNADGYLFYIHINGKKIKHTLKFKTRKELYNYLDQNIKKIV